MKGTRIENILLDNYNQLFAVCSFKPVSEEDLQMLIHWQNDIKIWLEIFWKEDKLV